MKPILTLLIVVAIQLSLRADQTIDDFSVGTADTGNFTQAGSPVSTSESGLSTANVAGGSRDLTAAVDSTSNAALEMRVRNVGSQLIFASDPGLDGQVTTTYDGNGGGLNLDLSAATAIAITVNGTDGDIPISVTIDGTTVTTTFQDGVDPEPGTITILLTDFTAAGLADLTDIDSISFLFNPATAVDFTLNLLNITGTVTPSGGGGGGGGATTGSEPSAILIWCLGAGLLVFWRFRPGVNPSLTAETA